MSGDVLLTTFVKESADFATAFSHAFLEISLFIRRTVGVTIFLGLSLKKAIEESGAMSRGILFQNDPLYDRWFSDSPAGMSYQLSHFRRW
ncbi:hypothetical protein K4A85_14215 [Bacillus pumilus]|nr:hypothetical protein K4A85_14215 [Bacillus pumilus]WOP21181.1 hypothetical protein R0I01_14555 [Bacillus pumilus]